MLVEIVLLWLVANLLPHAVVCLLAGKPYFALPPVQGLVIELIIMALNLTLPLLALTFLDHVPPSGLGEALAWRWNGWRTAAWGALGFVLGFVLLFPVVNGLVGSPPFAYGGGFGPLSLQDWPLLVLGLVLLLVTTLGEEVMFRGYMQTALAQRYGALLGPLGAAVLFALRHTPADLYWGSGAPAIEWVSRVLQLAGGALAFGWIRHRSGSTVST